jgi:hypothetical protein
MRRDLETSLARGWSIPFIAVVLLLRSDVVICEVLHAPQNATSRVAIIGAGIGGAAAALFLCNETVQCDV